MLRCEGLTQTYLSGGRELTVLKDITFTLEDSGFLAIVGPSGSGKTTLLGLLAGLDRPSRGNVFLDGADLGRMTEDERARLRGEKVGFVFQSFQLIPTLTARENVQVPLELSGRPADDRPRELLCPRRPGGAEPPLPGPALRRRTAARRPGPRVQPTGPASSSPTSRPATSTAATGQRHRRADARAQPRVRHHPRPGDARPHARGAARAGSSGWRTARSRATPRRMTSIRFVLRMAWRESFVPRWRRLLAPHRRRRRRRRRARGDQLLHRQPPPVGAATRRGRCWAPTWP